MPPKFKKRRLQFPSPPSKPGVAAVFLQEHYVNIHTGEDLKNGHILHIYIGSSRNERHTCDKLADIYGRPYSDFKYSVTRVVNMTLKKYHKLTNRLEMDQFESICAETFMVLENKSRPKLAMPSANVQVSNSPLKTKQTAACRNCCILRKSLKRSIKEIHNQRVKRRHKSKQKPKLVNAKLERRDRKVTKLGKKIAKLEEKLKGSQVGELEQKLAKLEKAKARKEKNICVLKKQLSNSKKEHSKDIKDLEVEYQDNILFLEEEIEHRRSESQSAPMVEFKKTGRMHTFRMRKMVYDCLMGNVPTEQIRTLIHSFALNFGVHMDVNDIPARSSIENMMIELGIISDLHTAEVITEVLTCTVGFDATTQEGIHVNSVHVTTEKDCHVLSLEQLAGGTADDYCNHVVRCVDHLAKVLVEFKPELYYSEVRGKIIDHIQCSLTDRASVNHAAVVKINESLGKTLVEVNCHLHPLDSIATKCKAALLSIEQAKNIKGKLLTSGCLAEKCILALNKARFVDGKGDPHAFRVFLTDEKLPQSLIIRYRGNRLHIMFKLAAVYVVHYERMKQYLLTKSMLNARLKDALISDFCNPVTLTELKVLAVIGKILTGPWLKKFSKSSEQQMHHLDAFSAVKQCLKSVRELAAVEEIQFENIEKDFFGDELERNEPEIWNKDPSPLFNSMLKAAFLSIVDVINRQYRHYYELEKEMTEDMRKSLDSARMHNMDSEEVIGMFSAIKAKAPRATLLFMSSKIKSKKNKTLSFLKALPENEAKAVVERAVTIAAKLRRCTQKSVKDLQKELSARIANKLHKKDNAARKALEKKIEQLMKSPDSDYASAFPSLDGIAIELLLDILDKRLVGKSVLHNWAEDGKYASETWNGKCEKYLPATKCKPARYAICYWGLEESYEENGTDWEITLNQAAADYICGDLRVLS